MKTSCPIVDTHASWLALNPIHGCPFKCKYCFMNGVGNTNKKPVVLCEPEDAVEQLLNYKNYNENMYLCLFSSTDIFSTPSNIEYAKKVIEIFIKKKIKNTIVFITKCYIPDDFLDLIDRAEKEGLSFVFFLSYSGLDSTIEKGINHEKIKQNFINLHTRNKKIIHYWRPFLPQNSTDERINEVLNFVKKYAVASVVIGLKVQDSFVENFEFWNDLIQKKNDACNYEGVWPANAYNKLYKAISKDYMIFRSTSCALSYCFKKADFNCYYGSHVCELNNCPEEQRKRCRNIYSRTEEELKVIIDEYLTKINKKREYEIRIEDKTIIINDTLVTSEIVTLKFLTGFSIVCSRDTNDHYWCTSHFEKKELII